jgi:hypothetical protein
MKKVDVLALVMLKDVSVSLLAGEFSVTTLIKQKMNWCSSIIACPQYGQNLRLPCDGESLIN